VSKSPLLEGEPNGLPLALQEGWTLDGIPAGWILVEGELDGLILVGNSPLEVGVLVEVEIDGTLLDALLAKGELDGVSEGWADLLYPKAETVLTPNRNSLHQTSQSNKRLS
jgi:hypothetical protein